jgi:aldehyde dehydrogenase (NAD+)
LTHKTKYYNWREG